MDLTLLILQLGIYYIIFTRYVIIIWFFSLYFTWFDFVKLFEDVDELFLFYKCECDRRAYDQAAIKFRGVDADINFNLSDYEDNMKQVSSYHRLLVYRQLREFASI